VHAFEMGKTSKKYDIKRLLRNNNSNIRFDEMKKIKTFDSVVAIEIIYIRTYAQPVCDLVSLTAYFIII